MHLDRLWLTDFRNYAQAELAPAPSGMTVVTGRNGEGKTNLLESIGYLSTLRSFRSAPAEALVRAGCERAIIRAEGQRAGRSVLLEAELRPVGRGRVLFNRQPLRRSADLAQGLQVTVFTPDDLSLVKGGPQQRRDYLDGVLAALHPRHEALRVDLERILKQRNALLKQAGGNPRPAADVVATLDVWDRKLAETGEALAGAREDLTARLGPALQQAYRDIVALSAPGDDPLIELVYQRSWEGPLLDALGRARPDDLRRAVSTVGPQRDELSLTLNRLPSRTHASQGEQRSLALALRLAGHHVVLDALGSPPILLLDDVFSELDPARAEALLASLPAGQALLTTAADIPSQAEPAVVVRVEGGKLLP